MTTTTDYSDIPAAVPERGGLNLLGLLRSWATKARQRREGRLTMFELSRMEEHLLRDMGINPADVEAAFAGRRSSVWLDPMRRYDRV
jgi:uncharacterized protein YjiS (DUF1127 family)